MQPARDTHAPAPLPPPAAAGRALEELSLEVSRRGFLKGTLAGSALLATAGLLPSGCARYEAPGVDLRVFDEKEYAVMKAVAERIVGPAEPGEPDASSTKVAEQFDAQLAFAPEEVRKQVKQMLQIFEHGTQLFFFSFKRFTQISPADQDRYIATWMESGMAFRKTVYWALKKISSAFFYATSSVWPSIDYDGPWVADPERFGRGWAERQLKNF